jgi:protein-S-isoprenylcysteine O-methyltransferase
MQNFFGKKTFKNLLSIMYSPWLPPYLSICASGFILGAVAMMSIMWILFYSMGILQSIIWAALGSYLLFGFVMFHLSEFTCAVLYRPHDCNPDSFLFFHSYAWLIAHGCAWFELIVRLIIFGAEEQWSVWRIVVGAILCVFFYSFRVKAMVDCGSNFSFQIEEVHRTTHQLVTNGIYKTLRHPSYFGSFWYFLSVQFLAGNWVCLVLFFFVLRYFFKDRIADEEQILESAEFFGEKYTEYKKSSYVGIPILNTPPFFV